MPTDASHLRPCRKRANRRLIEGLLAIVVTTGMVAGCGSDTVLPEGSQSPTPTPPPATKRPVGLPSNPTVLVEIDPEGNLSQRGSAPVDVAVSALDGGSVRAVESPDGTAIGFPAFESGAVYPRAVVSVTNAEDSDALNPGRGPFLWGADFRVRRVSAGPERDNGDNLVQRGIASDPVMFKAELDQDRAVCMVRGDEGELVARARSTVQPGVWYRLRCHRDADSLTLSLAPVSRGGVAAATARRTSGPVGDVHFEDSRIPLSVGGKLAHDGSVIGSATDQFNGDVANAYLQLRS